MQAPSSTLLHDHSITWESLLEGTKFTEGIRNEIGTYGPGKLTENRIGKVSRSEVAITASWTRLVDRLEHETRVIAETGPGIIPRINFGDIGESSKAEAFLAELRVRGVAVIHDVVSDKETKTWKRELDDYVVDNLTISSSSAEQPELGDVFWSPAQLSSRAHPNILAAQKFVMKGWGDETTQNIRGRIPSSPRIRPSLQSRVSKNFPVVYADRLRTIRRTSELPYEGRPDQGCHCDDYRGAPVWPHSCGYGDRSFGSSKNDGPYRSIWSGNWEDHDAWDTARRLDSLGPARTTNATMQAHGRNNNNSSGNGGGGGGTNANTRSAGAVFRMFEGMLCLTTNGNNPAGAKQHSPTRAMRICPLPLTLVTAYRLLRPFFASPSQPPTEASSPTLLTTTTTNTTTSTTATTTSCSSPDHNNNDTPDTPSDWSPTSGSLDNAHRESPLDGHGLVNQGQNDEHPLFHQHHHHYHPDPEFDLEKAFVAISPLLHPGDYLVWHPDVLCSASASASDDDDDDDDGEQQFPSGYYNPYASSESLFLSLPVCPLTQANAQFLARQRRAFLLGFPGPEFVSGHAGVDEVGESCHLGRPGVQEIHDVGGEEALRAMGLLAWDEDESTCAEEKQLLRLTNLILFPDMAKSKPR